jgi:hypothetical protein
MAGPGSGVYPRPPRARKAGSPAQGKTEATIREAEKWEVTVTSRAERFAGTVLRGPQAELVLLAPGVALPLASLYRDGGLA